MYENQIPSILKNYHFIINRIYTNNLLFIFTNLFLYYYYIMAKTSKHNKVNKVNKVNKPRKVSSAVDN